MLFKSLMVDLVKQIGAEAKPMHEGAEVTAAGFAVAMAALAVGLFATRTLPDGDYRMRQRWSDLYGLLAYIRSRCDDDTTPRLFTGPLSETVRRMGQDPSQPSLMVNTILSAIVSDSATQKSLAGIRRAVESMVETRGATIIVPPPGDFS